MLSRPDQLLSRLEFSVFFLSPSRQISASTSTKPQSFPSKSLHFVIHQSLILGGVRNCCLFRNVQTGCGDHQPPCSETSRRDAVLTNLLLPKRPDGLWGSPTFRNVQTDCGAHQPPCSETSRRTAGAHQPPIR